MFFKKKYAKICDCYSTFFIVCTGSGDNDFLRGDDECTLCGGGSLEHVFDQLFEGVYQFAGCLIFRRALNLIALQRFCVICRNSDFAAVCLQILQRGVQKNIPDYQFAIRRDVLKGNRYDIGLSICAGCQIPHVFA